MKNGFTVTKAEIMSEATAGEGCLGRAADDEPVFTIRAKDVQFGDTLCSWIAGARARGVAMRKIESARAVLQAGREWQEQHGSKLAD